LNLHVENIITNYFKKKVQAGAGWNWRQEEHGSLLPVCSKTVASGVRKGTGVSPVQKSLTHLVINAISTLIYLSLQLSSIAKRAFKNAGFQGGQGSFDALAGDLSALSGEGAIHLKLKCVDAQTTEMKIRVAARGNLKTSKLIYSLILKELSAASVPGSSKEVTP